MTDTLRATYLIETPLEPAHVAEVLAGEQSSGTFVRVAGETDALRQRWAFFSNTRVTRAYRPHTRIEVSTIRVAIAVAGPILPSASRFRIATEASVVSGEYRNTTVEIVVMALMNR